MPGTLFARHRWRTQVDETRSEQSQTYEFELTPCEKEQLEAIIDAVADGEADDIREADIYEGANRYRARFLRAKRSTTRRTSAASRRSSNRVSDERRVTDRSPNTIATANRRQRSTARFR